jgi:hypothetical protein
MLQHKSDDKNYDIVMKLLVCSILYLRIIIIVIKEY